MGPNPMIVVALALDVTLDITLDVTLPNTWSNKTRRHDALRHYYA